MNWICRITLGLIMGTIGFTACQSELVQKIAVQPSHEALQPTPSGKPKVSPKKILAVRKAQPKAATNPSLAAPNRKAKPDELKTLMRAGAALRARVFHRQGHVAFPTGFPDSVSGLFIGGPEAKLTGVEFFHGMQGLKRTPQRRFARIRFVTLAGRTALIGALTNALKRSGWSTSYPAQPKLIHDALGELSWTIHERVDRPTRVEFRAVLKVDTPAKSVAHTLLKRPPSWWSSVEKYESVAFEYSRFHHQKRGAAFTDIERITLGILGPPTETLRERLYGLAKIGGYSSMSEAKGLQGPHGESLVIDHGPGALTLVHHQARWRPAPIQ